MGKPDYIELGDSTRIPILFEDRSAMIVDKPRGWLLAPTDWETSRNLQAALEGCIHARVHWAKSRNLKFLRYVHRLDAETTGLLLLVKSLGAMATYSALFSEQQVRKTYLAVVDGQPGRSTWTCDLSLVEPSEDKRVRVGRSGKPARTDFKLLATVEGRSLIEAKPQTGRTHQIRVHLAAEGHPIVGDVLYGKPQPGQPLGLRATGLAYRAPFTGKAVRVVAPTDAFLTEFGFPLNLDTSMGAPAKP